MSRGRDWAGIEVAVTLEPAASVTFLSDKVTMRIRSIEGFKKRFGSPFFRSTNDLVVGNRAHLYLNMRFPKPIIVNQYKMLNLILDAKLKQSNILTGCLPGSPPPNAQNCYEPKRMGTQFRVAIGNITWTDSRCSKRDPADDICRYQGSYMQASLNLFDERFEFHNGDFFIQRGNSQTETARVAIYRIDLRDFLPSGTSQNPFHTGVRATAKGDLLAQIKKGLFLGELEGKLPPRLTKPNGLKEADDEYLSHYSIKTINLGYEVSGLSDMTFEIYKFSLSTD